MENKTNAEARMNKPSTEPRTAGQTASAASARAERTFEAGREQASEVAAQAKEKITDAYNKTSESVNQAYSQAVDFGKEHPGQMTLIAFGVGVGVGLLLAGSVSGGRSRSSRVVPPVMDALSKVAYEIFR